MHELAIANEIIRIARESVPPERAGEIVKINIEVGEFSCLQSESLEFAFQALSRETPLEKATLDIKRVKPLLECRRCARRYEPENGLFSPCPDCGTYGAEIVKGEELNITTIDLK